MSKYSITQYMKALNLSQVSFQHNPPDKEGRQLTLYQFLYTVIGMNPNLVMHHQEKECWCFTYDTTRKSEERICLYVCAIDLYSEA